MRKIALTLIVAGAAFATEASAQVIVRASSVPPGQRPPDGMCRVWIEGVAPGRQPSVTDCVTAQATAPLNSRIIYGGDGPFPGRAVGRFQDGRVLGERARTRDGRISSRIFGSRGDRIRDRDDDDRRISKAERNRVKALEKIRRDRGKQLSKMQKERERELRKAEKDRAKALKKAQKEREKALKRARKDAERNARRGNGRGNGRDG